MHADASGTAHWSPVDPGPAPRGTAKASNGNGSGNGGRNANNGNGRNGNGNVNGALQPELAAKAALQADAVVVPAVSRHASTIEPELGAAPAVVQAQCQSPSALGLALAVASAPDAVAVQQGQALVSQPPACGGLTGVNTLAGQASDGGVVGPALGRAASGNVTLHSSPKRALAVVGGGGSGGGRGTAGAPLHIPPSLRPQQQLVLLQPTAEHGEAQHMVNLPFPMPSTASCGGVSPTLVGQGGDGGGGGGSTAGAVAASRGGGRCQIDRGRRSGRRITRPNAAGGGGGGGGHQVGHHSGRRAGRALRRPLPECATDAAAPCRSGGGMTEQASHAAGATGSCMEDNHTLVEAEAGAGGAENGEGDSECCSAEPLVSGASNTVPSVEASTHGHGHGQQQLRCRRSSPQLSVRM